MLEFAKSKYDATFPMFAKIDVNGDDAAPLYSFLKAGHPTPDGAEDIAWNFTKFLVGKSGEVLARYEPGVTPEEIATQVLALVRDPKSAGEVVSVENVPRASS